MDFKIEKNIKVPKAYRNTKYMELVRKMKVGDSVFLQVNQKLKISISIYGCEKLNR